jgi:maltose O-acetyltransferase
MRTEQQKMLAGVLYDPADAALVAGRDRAASLCRRYNQLDAPAASDERRAILAELFAAPTDATVTAPFSCDYGHNIRLGSRVYFNFNCVILDVALVTIGSNVLFGPGAHIYTAMHPISAAERRLGLESGQPVTIGDDVWIGGGAIICPGVSIGDGAVIGAGSVVTRAVPGGVLAAGNPCRVLRALSANETCGQ